MFNGKKNFLHYFQRKKTNAVVRIPLIDQRS